ncbi:hypothetical protein [Ralstonia chuxiongensis]|uniref:Uncharacterized protein n=1 Tax=Ralstonia chuxiongensis TaxID=2957504 RepID=A0AA41WUZ3_9RALS|nr:hypothetical protein [Ralstonia chuxiongensis]MCP1175660.1 hypothetical protein [Ralstonia chuxiongensis]
MRLIEKKKNPQNLQLTSEEAASVRRYCGAGMKAEEQDAQVVAGILAKMHDGKEPRYWLECDCRDGEASEHWPRMTARIRGDGPRHFVRIVGRDTHTCVLKTFRTDPSEDEDDAQAEPGKHRALRPIRNSLDYLDKAHEAGGKRPSGQAGSSSGKSRSRRLPKLGRILYTLLDQAGFSTFSTDDLDTGKKRLSPWDRLEQFAVEEEVTEALTLWDMMETRAWIKPGDFMAEVDKLQWPKGKKRMGYLLFVANQVTAAAATKLIKGKPVVVAPASEIRIGGRDQNFANPPYWVLAVIDRDDNGVARVREAFAQLAFNMLQPVPLDSSYERHTLALLLKVMEGIKRRGVTVTLKKPLFDSEVTLADGTTAHCRADFELEVPAPAGSSDAPGRLLIETMGADSQEYLDQKQGTHRIMRQRGAIIEHVVRHDSEQAERDDRLRKRVYACVMELAGVPRQDRTERE